MYTQFEEATAKSPIDNMRKIENPGNSDDRQFQSLKKSEIPCNFDDGQLFVKVFEFMCRSKNMKCQKFYIIPVIKARERSSFLQARYLNRRISVGLLIANFSVSLFTKYNPS